jgi:uncharacterized protein
LGATPPASGPFAVAVTDLLRRPGTRRSVHVVAPVPDLALSSSRVPAGADVEVDLTLEAISDHSLTAAGTVRAPWTGECRRCLRPVEGEAVTDVLEVFERDPVEGETYPLGSDRVDLLPLVRDAVLLALPLAPLCDDDCAGADPDDYPVHAEDEDEQGGALDAPPPPDPRWAALDDLRFDD